jgi:mRNA interferase MazF
MERGEIWWATLPAARSSEPGFRRPVLIIQSDAFNRSRIQTVVVAVVTSNTRLARAPGNVALDRKHSGLPKPSVVNVSQIVTVDKSFLTERVGKLQPGLMSVVDSGVKLILSV